MRAAKILTPILLTAIFADFAPPSFSHTQSKKNQGNQPSVGVSSSDTPNVPMPTGFADVHLGMSVRELVAARPHVETFSLFDGTKPIDLLKPNQGLQERLSQHPLFANAFYSFKNGSLNGIILVSSERGVSNAEVQKFLGGLTALYGKPFRYAVVEYQSGHEKLNSPGIYWLREPALIAVSIPPLDAQGQAAQGDIGLEIGLSSDWKPEKFFAQRHLSKKDEDKVVVPVSALVDRILKTQNSKP